MNKKIFLSGIVTGVAVLLIVNTLYTTLISKGDIDFATKVNVIKTILEKNYVNEVNDEKLDESMYLGLVYGIGDPYTSYMDKSTYKDFSEKSKGVFAGIGVGITVDTKDNRVVVDLAYEGFPGSKAGLLPGDKIIKVNGEDVTGDNLQGVVNKLKGKEGTSVKLSVLRESEGRMFDVELVREVIELPTVSHEMMENGVGYLRITAFDEITLEQYNAALADLKAQGMNGMIIDLRNNPGGLLDVVTKIADTIVPECTTVYTEDKNGNRKDYNSTGAGIGIPIVVIVNGSSASASEVLAGAIKDTDSGVLVGEKTYGKGVVQSVFPLTDGSAVKVTIAKYYTPSGTCIDGVGIEPDYPVGMDEKMSARIQELTLEEDVQLQKALEVIKGKL
ncbi:MAG: S41 family peptidase [Clostridiales bacterium]|nr:S41 family peptidase [Clostridiales bacterium]